MSTDLTIQNYDLGRADTTLHLANDLAKFIRDNKLTTNVQGKEFVNIEGWTYAGSRLGIVPMVEYLADLTAGDDIRYECKVTLYDLSRREAVGVGIARCSNKEPGKKFFADYAVASMCQTRAIGKAYRNLLGWIIKAAGYEPTTAEEMDSLAKEPTLADACLEALQAADLSALQAVAKKHNKAFGKEEAFRTAGLARRNALQPKPSPTLPKLATDAQKELLFQYLRSHHNDQVRDDYTAQVDDELTMDRMSELLEQAKANIENRVGDGGGAAV